MIRERGSVIPGGACWVVFIHVVRGHPSDLLQFSKGEAVKIYLLGMVFVQFGRTGRNAVLER